MPFLQDAETIPRLGVESLFGDVELGFAQMIPFEAPYLVFNTLAPSSNQPIREGEMVCVEHGQLLATRRNNVLDEGSECGKL